MNEKLKQQFEEQLAYLPTINQEALKSFDWASELIGIGKNYGLHIDELEDLQIETMLLLVGLTSPDDYENELITRLAISPVEARKIIEDINIHVFTPIHDYIVNGGTQKKPPVTGDIMSSVGIEITKDETPLPAINNTNLVRTGGSNPVVQSIPDSKPITTGTTPLQFHPTPENNPAVPTPVSIPETKPVVTQPPIVLSKEKLEQVSQNRQKIIDATLQSMDQV